MKSSSNKSQQATWGGRFCSAIAEDVISPACLSGGPEDLEMAAQEWKLT